MSDNSVPEPDPAAVWLAEREQEVRASRPTVDEEEPPMPTEKECARCHKTKPFDAFAKGTSKYGLHSWCRDCNREANRERTAAKKATKKPAREPEPQSVPTEPTTIPTEPTTGSSAVLTSTPPLTEYWIQALRSAAEDPTLSRLEALATFLDGDLSDAVAFCKELTADA